MGPLEVAYFDPSYPFTFGHLQGPYWPQPTSSHPHQQPVTSTPGADALNAQTNELTEVEKPVRKDDFFRIVTVNIFIMCENPPAK